ncbi:MAG: type I CRISPR-associated protein Cas7 [Bacteroidales bacterium]
MSEIKEFKNRVFGCAVVKAINANYNADFSGQPRTLPNGVVYATDKAFKYTIKNYMKDVFDTETIFYFKSLNSNLNPISLDEMYKKYFGDFPEKSKKDNSKKGENDKLKIEVATNLLSCIDIRLFGATFAGETNISIHGPVQINHGVNIWKENNIFSEQITSPFSNKADSNKADSNKADGSEIEKGMTTIGRQSKLEEGHYLHHYSVNPSNLKDIVETVGTKAHPISMDDINKLKEAMRRGVTWYDSASKSGCENEILFWVQLNENSKIVLPNFTTLIDLLPDKKDGKCIYDCVKLTNELNKISDEIEKIELYYNQITTNLINLPKNITQNDL